MSNITQTIPSYTGGISQQPDELKLPGQVVKAKNVYPDLVNGLTKRPGGKLIQYLTNSTNLGRWFHYYRDENEQYIGQIARNGVIKMWCCSDIYVGGVKKHDAGDEITVISNITGTFDYLTHTDDEDIQTLTLNDYTYITNRTKTVAMKDPAVAKSADGSNITFGRTSNGNIDVTYKNHGFIVGQHVHLKFTSIDNSNATSTFVDKDYYVKEILSDDSFRTSDPNYTGPLTSSGTVTVTDSGRPPEAYVELKKVAYARQYALNLYNSTATADLSTTRTATRIKVHRVKDSSNQGDDNHNISDNRANRINYSKRVSNGDNNDAYCPNTGSMIVHASHGQGITDEGCITAEHTEYVAVKTTNGSAVNRGTNLYFRVQTIGQAVPLQDATTSHTNYQCRYTTTHDLYYGGEGWHVGDHFHFWMKDGYYRVTILETSISTFPGNLGVVRPNPTSFDAKTVVTSESVLGDLQAGIVAESAFTSDEVKIVGNGIYITNETTFNVDSPTADLLNVITSEASTIEELPTQCKHGYVVKVINSVANEDDYYVKFQGENGRDGPGVWEECPKPGRNVEIDKETMPYELVRSYDSSNNRIIFTLDFIDWDKCDVGDWNSATLEGTVPDPSFIGKTINKMVFFRNRLVMLSDENIIMSRPGDFYNFWPRSAITFSATDVIDISCSSEYPAIVYDAIQVNAGLVLFTKNKQFMLTTDSDVLSPQTAKINSLATYNFNHKTNPISLGTTIGFLDNAGKHSRFWEVAKILREGEPIVIDQSKVVEQLFDKDLELVSNSRENGVIFFSKKDTKTLYGYKYFNSSEQRLQQAWFTWELQGNIQHHAVLDDALFVVVRGDANRDVLLKYPLRKDDDENDILDRKGTNSDDTDDITYRIHLDNSAKVDYTSLTYDATNDWTTFPLQEGFHNSSSQLAAYVIPKDGQTDYDQFQGFAVNATTFVESGATKVKLPGNWKTFDPQYREDGSLSDDVTPVNSIVLGYQFDMEVEFPTIYYSQVEGESYRALLNGSLIIHRIKLNFGANGLYSTILDRVGKPTYTELWEPTISDQYKLNRVQINEQSTRTIPAYEKNKNLTLTLKSTHPTPATLYSMTWEGVYTNQNYKRV